MGLTCLYPIHTCWVTATEITLGSNGCQCVFVDHKLVHAITCRLFKLESPNLQSAKFAKCKTHWLRSLLVLGAIDLDLQGQLEFESKFTQFRAYRCDKSPQIEARISKFGPKCIHYSTVKIPINFGLDWPWPSDLILIVKPVFFLPNFKSLIYLCRLYIISNRLCVAVS